MRHSNLAAIGGFLVTTALALPALAAPAAHQGPASAGTINYLEGQVSMGTETLGPNSAGSAVLAPGQILTTENGKAEVLLTPGVFARVGDNSAIEMISPDLTHTEVSVRRGEAIVEVAELHPENDLLVNEDGATVQVEKTGLYDFDGDHFVVRVFDGQAAVQAADERVQVKGSHELNLKLTPLRARKFDRNSEQGDDLYRWSSLRSAYVAEANVDAAPSYLGWGGWYGGGWIGSGWYWDPWFSCYTYIPGDGIFYSPFGWGFYSPWWAYRAPIDFGGRYYHHFGPNVYRWGPGAHYVPAVRGGGYGNGFRPSSRLGSGASRSLNRGLDGGGFHGGGELHGGEFGGGGFGGGHGGAAGHSR